jgi:hypothetical protein
MAPGGQICAIPDNQLAQALADGGKLVNEYQISDRNQRQAMAHRAFEEEQKRKRSKAFQLRRRRYGP